MKCSIWPSVLLAVVMNLGGLSVAHAQAPTRATATGWELSAIPALNFNSDEGVGYGIILHTFNYGDGTPKPYRYTLQPQFLMTKKGRRDVSFYFDAPHVLPGEWRVSGNLAHEQQLATPYYGLGNSSIHDELNEADPNPYFYRYGRKGFRASGDLQHRIRGSLRLLTGAGYRTSTIDKLPFDSGTTLLALETTAEPAARTRLAMVRGGLIYDSRNRETGTSKGQWIETILQHVLGKSNGEAIDFWRVTATARTYVPLHERLVWAQRATGQHATGDAPFFELTNIQGSHKESEGLGGANTVRGLPRNRYAGNDVVFVNEELRWTAAQFGIGKRESALVLSAFADGGRVWTTADTPVQERSALHVGVGGGARLRYGHDFVVALDVGHSKESKSSMYIGLGYLF